MATKAGSQTNLEDEWKPNHAVGLSLVGLALGLAAERLFYGRPLGVSFPIWVALLTLALLIWGRLERRSVDQVSAALLLAAVVHALIVLFRAEPLTNFLAVTGTLGLLVIGVRALRPGGLGSWSWLDFAVAGLWVPLESWIRPWTPLAEAQRRVTKDGKVANISLAALRGLLLALPAVVIFLTLLSSADPIFKGIVEDLIEWLNLERILDWIGRGLYALVVGIFALGIMIVGLRRDEQEELVNDGEPVIKRFLGLVESGVVLGSVDLIFAVFVGVQVRYLFGGEANIGETGFTYAEYARRGFGELLAVSILSLGLILLLGAVTRRRARRERRTFEGLATVMVLLTGVMLFSALQRLTLYERAYGFSRLRTYSHVAIWWLGLLDLAFLVLLYRRQLARFAQVLVFGAVGFSLTLSVVNVDALIVRRNLEHHAALGRLDGRYLTTLSSDAVPALVEGLPRVPVEERPVILAGLSCQRHILAQRSAEAGWPGFRLSHARARRALRTIGEELEAYPLQPPDGEHGQIKFEEDEYLYCGPYFSF